jgi:hypothetical protein
LCSEYFSCHASQVRDSVLAGVSGAGIMVDSSIDASTAASAAAATGASASEQPILRRSLSSEYFAGKGASRVTRPSISSL